MTKARSQLTPEELARSRRHSRESRERIRLKRWIAAAVHQTRCPAMLGSRHPCHGPLTSRVVAGVTVPVCDRCELHRKGICIRCCREPVYGASGNALRCRTCHIMVKRAADLRRRKQQPPKRRVLTEDQRIRRNAATRASQLARPEHCIKVKHAWEQTPRAKATRQRHHLRYSKKNRARILARQAAYRLAKKEGRTQTHACFSCPTRLVGNRLKCDACRERSRAAARAIVFRDRAAA